jgi:hypothetical protein
MKPHKKTLVAIEDIAPQICAEKMFSDEEKQRLKKKIVAAYNKFQKAVAAEDKETIRKLHLYSKDLLSQSNYQQY